MPEHPDPDDRARMPRPAQRHDNPLDSPDPVPPGRDVTRRMPLSRADVSRSGATVMRGGATVMRAGIRRGRLAWAAKIEYRIVAALLLVVGALSLAAPGILRLLTITAMVAFVVCLLLVRTGVRGRGGTVEIGCRLILLLGLAWLVYAAANPWEIGPLVTGLGMAHLLPWAWRHYRSSLLRPDEPEAEPETFPDVGWLKGARWAGPAQATRSGEARTLDLPAGMSARHFAATRSAGFAGVLRRPAEQVELREGQHAGEAVVLVHSRDLLAEPSPWPPRHAASASLWDGVPFGTDRSGEPLTLDLVEKHALLVGESGAGKSNGQALIVAAAALDPTTDLILLDGKGADLPGWRDRASAYVGNDPAAACNLLAALQRQLDARYAQLAERGQRKVAPGAPLTLLALDELAAFLLCPDRKLAAEFRSRLLDLLQRGRACGLIICAATQHPSATMITSDLRAGFTLRAALRTSSSEAGRMVFGDGLDVDPARLDPARRGLAWVQTSGMPKLVRCHYLPDDELAELQRRTARHGATALPPPAAPAPSGPTYPDGSPVPATDRKLWSALTAAAGPVSVKELQALGDLGARQSIVDRLTKLTAAGYVERIDGRPPQVPHTYAVAGEDR